MGERIQAGGRDVLVLREVVSIVDERVLLACSMGR